MYPEMSLPDPLTYRWLFFEYYLGWRYSFGTVYTVIDSLAVFVTPLFLAGVPFFFGGLYYSWKKGEVEKGFFFLAWFATVLFVFLPAKFQLNYYYYPAFVPYFCLVANGIYEMAVKNKKLLLPSKRIRMSLSVFIACMHVFVLYLPLMRSGTDPVYLFGALLIITGGSVITTAVSRNLFEILAGWISIVALHRFLTRVEPGIMITLVIITAVVILILFCAMKLSTVTFPVRSTLMLGIVIFTGVSGVAMMITGSHDDNLHADKIANYIMEKAGTGNFTCWVENDPGLACALRYEVGNPFFAYFSASHPFSSNRSSVLDSYVASREILFWVVFVKDYGLVVDIRKYEETWNYFTSLEGINDASEEAGLPDGSIVRIYANSTRISA